MPIPARVPDLLCMSNLAHASKLKEHVILGGVAQKNKVAHFRLCHSRKPFVVAYPNEVQEMVAGRFHTWISVLWECSAPGSRESGNVDITD